MDLQKLDEALLALFEKRVELSQMGYDHASYDDIEEELHDLEDDFNDEYGLAPYIISIGQVMDCHMAIKSSRGMSNIAQILR